MLTLPYVHPHALSEAAEAAARAIVDAAQRCTLQDLAPFMSKSGEAAIGVLVDITTHLDGSYRDATFAIVGQSDAADEGVVHADVPIMRGYSTAERTFRRAVENGWIAREMARRVGEHGRELASLTDAELDALPTYRYSFCGRPDAEACQEAILAELARHERAAREDESSHARMEAIAASKAARERLAQEIAEAEAWWDSLAQNDQDGLPSYGCKKLPMPECAVLTRRDFEASRGRKRPAIAGLPLARTQRVRSRHRAA